MDQVRQRDLLRREVVLENERDLGLASRKVFVCNGSAETADGELRSAVVSGSACCASGVLGCDAASSSPSATLAHNR